MELARDFIKLNKGDVLIAGGKGASLGEMLQAGIPVPDGFVVLSTTFDRFIEETDLDVEIDSILDKVNYQEISSVENASEEIKALILNAEMPNDIAEEIKKKFNNLGAKFVAVRSSATSEDSSTAAWAGQLESYLNTTKDLVLENVKKCWASLFTPRAIFYRKEKNLHKSKISVAVVIQKMVESECSGIAFSVHPVTQDENQIIIEAGFGLGEAIVSGQITPDSYVIEKEPRRIIDKNINTQERGLYKSSKGGNEWKTIGKETGSKQVLSDNQIYELVKIILRIESHYGFPCDIEWAMQGDKFYIVQSRPITTLEKKDEIEKKPFEDILNRCLLLTARSSSIQRETIFGSHFLKNKFYPMDFLLTMPVSGTDVEWYLDKITLEKFFNKEAEEFLSQGFLEEYKRRNEQGYKELIKIYSRINKDFTKKNIVINQEVIDNLKNYFNYSVRDDTYFYFGLCVWTFDQRVVPKLKERLQNLLKEDFDESWHIITSQTELSNEQKFRIDIAELKKRYGDKIKKEELQKIQENYRYLGIYCPEDYGYTYEDIQKFYHDADVDKTLNIVKDIQKNKKQFEELLRKHRGDKKTCEIMSLINFNVYFRTIRMEKILNGFALLTPMYDYLMKELGFTRKQVGNLTKEELINFFEKKIIPPQRKSHPGMFYTAEGGRELTSEERQLFEKKFRQSLNVDQFNGNIAYKGLIKGKVKIVTSNADLSKVQEGDILVSQFTRPEYLPAMKKSSAIITNDGGITSHAAITSRELKKPCIIGTKIATKVLHDDDEVEVDANTGVVKILKKAKPKQESRGLIQYFIKNADENHVELWPPVHNNSAFIQASGWNSKKYYANYYKLDLSNQLILLQDKDKAFQLVDAVLLKGTGEEFFKDYLKNPSILKNREKILLKNIKLIDNYYKNYTYKKISKVKSQKLIELAKEILDIMWDTNSAVYFSAYFDKELCSKILHESNIDTAFLDKFWEEFTKPAFPSFDAEAYLDYKNKKNIEDLQYIFTTYLKAFDLEYVKNRLKDKYSNFDKKIFQDIELQKRKIKNINKSLKPIESKVGEYIQMIMYLRDKRKNFFNKGITVIWRIAEKIFNNCNINCNLIQYTLMQEFFKGEEHINGLKDQLELRKEGFVVLVPYEGEPSVELGGIDDKVTILNNYFIKIQNTTSDVIKGQPAHKGKVVGIVKIVKDAHNATHFNQGDILVTGMTRPEYVPLMKKASAVITDEGGITCHAAIVSRELGIPCIIGTKTATHILKNGDKIEVNANEGIVKIIKRA